MGRPKKIEDPLEDLFFYNYIYKERLKWTGHLIPVLYLDVKTGFYMEGYLNKVSKVEDPDSLVKIKVACLPTLFMNQVEIPMKYIYPTNRRIIDSVTKAAIDPIPYQEIINPPKNSVVFTRFNLRRFFTFYPGTYFSENYIKKAFNNKEDITDLLKSLNYVEQDFRPCLISSSSELSFKKIENMQLEHIYTEDFTELRDQYLDCNKCSLGISRSERSKPVVFSKGPVPAEIMVIGEAPGKQEEQNSVPFFENAPAGGALKKVIETAKLDYDSIHFTNSVLCRPLPPEGSKSQNGKPTLTSIKACNARLKNQVRLVSPKIVVLLGKYAYEAFTGRTLSSLLSSVGWQQTNSNYHVYLAEHPSYIIRQLLDASYQDQVSIKLNYLNHWKEISKKLKELN